MHIALQITDFCLDGLNLSSHSSEHVPRESAGGLAVVVDVVGDVFHF